MYLNFFFKEMALCKCGHNVGICLMWVKRLAQITTWPWKLLVCTAMKIHLQLQKVFGSNVWSKVDMVAVWIKRPDALQTKYFGQHERYMCMSSFFIAVTDRAENLDLLSQQLKKSWCDGTRVATVTCFAQRFVSSTGNMEVLLSHMHSIVCA